MFLNFFFFLKNSFIFSNPKNLFSNHNQVKNKNSSQTTKEIENRHLLVLNV